MIDTDFLLAHTAVELNGVDPRAIRSQDEVDAIREDRRSQQAAQQQAENNQRNSQAVNNLAQAEGVGGVQ